MKEKQTYIHRVLRKRSLFTIVGVGGWGRGSGRVCIFHSTYFYYCKDLSISIPSPPPPPPLLFCLSSRYSFFSHLEVVLSRCKVQRGARIETQSGLYIKTTEASELEVLHVHTF